MVKVRKRILKRSYKKKQYRYERYYLEVPTKFNNLIAELYGRPVNIEMEKTQNELLIRLRVELRRKGNPAICRDNKNSCFEVIHR